MGKTRKETAKLKETKEKYGIAFPNINKRKSGKKNSMKLTWEID